MNYSPIKNCFILHQSNAQLHEIYMGVGHDQLSSFIKMFLSNSKNTMMLLTLYGLLGITCQDGKTNYLQGQRSNKSLQLSLVTKEGTINESSWGMSKSDRNNWTYETEWEMMDGKPGRK